MPRFLFHLHDCGRFTVDEEGREFDSLDTAIEAAKCEARSLLASQLRDDGVLCLGLQLEVVEEGSKTAYRVPFTGIVRLENTIVQTSPTDIAQASDLAARTMLQEVPVE